MNYPKHHHHHARRKHTERPGKSPDTRRPANPESTGTESAYLKSLVSSRARVTVTMMDGERFQGRIRYYDRYCFSVGLLSEKKNLFLRKENVSHITEE